MTLARFLLLPFRIFVNSDFIAPPLCSVYRKVNVCCELLWSATWSVIIYVLVAARSVMPVTKTGERLQVPRQSARLCRLRGHCKAIASLLPPTLAFLLGGLKQLVAITVGTLAEAPFIKGRTTGPLNP